MKTNTLLMSVFSIFLLSACSSKSSSYSMLGSSQEFKQEIQDNRVDVLWVIDNSGSMAPSQQNLADNFPSFIADFQSSGFDFRIAVTTSDAFLSLPAWTSYYNQSPKPSVYQGGTQAEIAKFRDGLGSNHTGVFVIDNNTPNIHDVFMTNIKQGVTGSGDERSIQSLRAAIDSTLNANFLRPGAFLAVVIVTDEDDFSHDGTAHLDGQYSNTALHPIQNYVNYLDGVTASTGATRRYSVNSVAIKDTACATALGGSPRRVATRVHELVDSTSGTKANLCGSFALELKNLAQGIISLASQFYLKAEPVVSTIRVFVNGQELPKTAWSYNAAANSIVFAPNHVPPSGARIEVPFDPKQIIF